MKKIFVLMLSILTAQAVLAATASSSSTQQTSSSKEASSVKPAAGAAASGAKATGAKAAAAPTVPNKAAMHPNMGTHPKTQVVVNRPQTPQAGGVNRPVTSVAVFRPVTTVTVQHPVTSVTQPDGSKAPQTSGGAQPTKQSSDAAVGKKPSMMSQYKAPKATDFKAAKTGSSDGGLGGKTDEKVKDAAAASPKMPKFDAGAVEAQIKQAKEAE